MTTTLVQSVIYERPRRRCLPRHNGLGFRFGRKAQYGRVASHSSPGCDRVGEGFSYTFSSSPRCLPTQNSSSDHHRLGRLAGTSITFLKRLHAIPASTADFDITASPWGNFGCVRLLLSLCAISGFTDPCSGFTAPERFARSKRRPDNRRSHHTVRSAFGNAYRTRRRAGSGLTQIDVLK